MQISINSKVTKADMVWLEQQFETRGFTLQIATMGLQCHVADFQSAFPQVSRIPLPDKLDTMLKATCDPLIGQDGVKHVCGRIRMASSAAPAKGACILCAACQHVTPVQPIAATVTPQDSPTGACEGN